MMRKIGFNPVVNRLNVLCNRHPEEHIHVGWDRSNRGVGEGGSTFRITRGPPRTCSVLIEKPSAATYSLGPSSVLVSSSDGNAVGRGGRKGEGDGPVGISYRPAVDVSAGCLDASLTDRKSTRLN